MYIYSYNERSESAKQLSIGLDAPRVKHNHSKFKGDKSKIIINWGSSELPKEVMKCHILNHPNLIAISTNKLNYLDMCFNSDVRVPEFTENKEQAKGWIEQGHAVICRRILNGSSGVGIIYSEAVNKLVNAPLYTKYVPKKDEYRIHCFFDALQKGLPQIFYVQRKYRNPEKVNPNWIIRNIEGGFLYEHNNINPPKDVLDQSLKAFKASNLNFGAVDVIWNEKKNKAYVLEINTAPGLEGQTLHEYIKMFNEMI